MKHITIIIGGLGLIGKKVVHTFLNAGNNVEIWDIRDPNKDEKYYYNKYNNIEFKLVDFTSEEDLIKAINICEKDNNSISNVVNLAYPRNKNYGSDFKEVSYDNFTENVSMNLGGYF